MSVSLCVPRMELEERTNLEQRISLHSRYVTRSRALGLAALIVITKFDIGPCPSMDGTKTIYSAPHLADITS